MRRGSARIPPLDFAATAVRAVLTCATALACLLAPGAVRAAEPPPPPKALTLKAYRLPAAAAVDGDLRDWKGCPPEATAVLDREEQTDPRRRGGWSGPADAGGRVRIGVHGEILCLGVDLTDDAVFHDTQRAWWHGDSLELFVNADLEAQETASGGPPHAYSPGCWQIFLMPANADLPWGVVFRGRRMHFDDAGLRGVRVARGAEHDGGYEFEVGIPLHNFGVEPGRAARLGLALALNDSDEAPEKPGTYLSWNQGFDLYLHPDHFGVLELPPRPSAGAASTLAEEERGASAWWPLLGVLLAVLAALALAGPGARALARVGPRAKWTALALTGVLGLAVHLEAELSVSSTEADEREGLAALADEAAHVLEAAQSLGAIQEEDAEQRARALVDLLEGRRIRCRPGVEAAALVPLHERGAFSSQEPPSYRLSLRQGRSFVLARASPAARFRVRLDPILLGRDPDRRLHLGNLVFQARDGAPLSVPLLAPAPKRADPGPTVPIQLQEARAWREIRWEPNAAAPPAVLRGIDRMDEDDRPHSLLLTSTTLDGVPVLAHAGGPDQGRTLAPGETATFGLPTLAEADRLWVLLSVQKAFPHLLGDHVLGRLSVAYDSGPAPPPLEVRNVEHLTAQRLLPGVEHQAPTHGREAFRWRDTMGNTHIQQALPIPLEPRRLARSLTVENLGVGGDLRVVAATVVRTRRAPADGPVHVDTDDPGADRLFLVSGVRDFEARLGSREGADVSTGERVTLERHLGSESRATRLSLSAPLPDDVANKRERARIALLACLAIALFLGVLLVVDAAGRLRLLSWRLAAGVLAAALVPLAVTILLVERENTTRVESAYAATAQTGVKDVLARLEETQDRVQDVASQLARHLVAERGPGELGEVSRVAMLYGDTALAPGLCGTVSVSGAALPPMHVPLAGRREAGREGGLDGPRYLDGMGDRPGPRVSPWDGLVLVGSARAGQADDWVRVVIGIRIDDLYLHERLREAVDDPSACAVVLDERGLPLVRAGPRAEAMRRALEGRVRDLTHAPTAGGGRVLQRLVSGSAEHLVAAASLSAAGAPGDRPAWLTLGLPRAAIDRAVAAQRMPLLWLGLFGLVLVVGVAALVARRVADPVRELVRATDAVRKGTFDVEVPRAGADEVGRLTVAFDQMRRDLKHRVEDLDFLRGAQEVLAASLDFGTRADAVLQLFAGRFGSDEAVLLDARDGSGPVTVVAEAGGRRRFGERPLPVSGTSRLARALAAGNPVELEGPPAGGAPPEEAMAERLLAGCRAWLAVPLRTGSESQGLALLGWKDAGALPRQEARRLLEPLAGIAAAALNNARLYRLAALDDVTRLPGATSFEAALREDVERAVAGGPPAVLLRIGLDHLEHVALRRGVELSRGLLRGCAAGLQGVVGERLRLGRLREEELAVRLPGASPEDARTLAETVRERLGAVVVRPDEGGESLATTVSIGVARCPGDARSLEFLLDAAGRALAAAQREGGDRVEDAARLGGGAVDLPPFEEGAVFRNQKMVRVVEAARRAARTDASVFITGETGTGKEVIANLIHRRSAREGRPFVTVNCAAFPETLLESELFGHERGAFTGAERRREGRFELADGGTLFLDEVAEMTPSAQVKLLRVLQERQFTRLGGTRTITVDVRIIAATNRDLERAVTRGAFREDLYYRLNVIRLEVPPLRERREEIPPLVDLFLREATRRAGGGPKGLTSGAMDVLYRHPWPGNVRELKNVIERCAVLCEAERVGAEHLQLDASRGENGAHLPPRGAPLDDLNERQRKLLDHLARHGRCTNRDYYQMAGTSPRTGLRDLQDLMRRGFLVREGKRRGAVYRLP